MVTAVRAFVVASLCALCAYGASGCGTETVGAEELAQAATTSERTNGFRVGLVGSLETAEGEFDMTGSGVMDMRGQRGDMTMVIRGQKVRQVMDRYVMYMQMPQLEPALEDGKEWAKLDLNRYGKEMGVDIGAVQQPGSSDPRQMFNQLKAMSGEIEKVGTEEVRGVEATHYSGEVDIDRLHEVVPADRREAARKSIERAKEISGIGDYPLDVWVDEDDQVRRMRMQMDMKVQGQDIAFDFTMDYFDYGTRVDVQVPPENEVQDLTELAGQGQSGFGGP
jgi:hypothetical protein